MRLTTLAVCGGLLAASAAVAAPVTPAPPAIERDVVAVQDGLLPRFFGGGSGDSAERQRAEMAMRIDQLEQQVRMLTGQVETLTFTVRRLERVLEAEGRLPPRTDAAAPPATATVPPAGSASQIPSDGPLDLSAINRGLSEALAPAPGSATPEPVSTPALQSARESYRSGRYAIAAQEARQVLADNPTGPVAGEARFLLGEVLLAQGSYRNAATLFLENYTSDPTGARAPASLLKLSTALNGLGEREAACSSLEEFFGAYPDVDPELRAAAERERQAANCT